MSSFKAFVLGLLVSAIGVGIFHYSYCLAPTPSLVADSVQVTSQPTPLKKTSRTIRLSSISIGQWKLLLPYLPVHAGDDITIRAEPIAESSTGLRKKRRQAPDCKFGIRVGMNGEEVYSNEKGQFDRFGVAHTFAAQTDGNIYIAQIGSDPTVVFIEVRGKGN